MLRVNEFYSPDYQQAHEHHVELLKKSEQEKFAVQALKTTQQKTVSSNVGGWLRHWLSNYSIHKMAQTASRSPSSRT